MIRRVPFLLALISLCACGAQRPVLYPNEHLQSVGSGAAQAAIDQCMAEAEQYVKGDGRAGKVARDTAIGGGTGAAVGAAAGAVTGNAGRGAAQGAAAGATGGFLHGIFRSSAPSPVYKNFVDRCLRERGYEPIGWE